MSLKRFKKPLLFPAAIIAILSVFFIIFAAILCVIVLFSLGLLSLAVSAGSLVGIMTPATDLSPPAMLLTGFSCVFSALSLLAALFITAPKAVAWFHRVWEWFRLSG